MYDSVIPAIKMSIVVFYWRVFAIRSFRMVLYFVTFLVMGWWFSILIVACVQCRPYSYFWNQYVDPTAKGTCINTYYFFIGNGAASVITDFIILICPIPMVWKLQMPIAQRLSVISIFLLGGLWVPYFHTTWLSRANLARKIQCLRCWNRTNLFPHFHRQRRRLDLEHGPVIRLVLCGALYWDCIGLFANPSPSPPSFLS